MQLEPYRRYRLSLACRSGQQRWGGLLCDAVITPFYPVTQFQPVLRSPPPPYSAGLWTEGPGSGFTAGCPVLQPVRPLPAKHLRHERV